MFLEEQVADLQGQIRKLTEEVMGLRVENNELNSKLALTELHGTTDLANAAKKQSPPPDIENRQHYKVGFKTVFYVEFCHLLLVFSMPHTFYDIKSFNIS